VRFLPGASHDLLLLQVERPSADLGRLKLLGLTRREAEVLAWVAQGKTNAEVAKILAMSSRTVQKHMEPVMAKLGVENRTGATRVALRAVPAS
jgi:DNA-binding CsgD family transcriptional regulator